MLVVISISCPYQRAAVSALREATNNFSILAVTRRWSYQWTMFFCPPVCGCMKLWAMPISAVSRHIWKTLQMDWDFHNSGTVNSYNHQPTFNDQLFPFQHSWKFSAWAKSPSAPLLLHSSSVWVISGRGTHYFPTPGQCQTRWTWNPCDL